MEKNFTLTEGHITSKLIKLALPIMGTSLFQMAYNMADMIWIGKLGSRYLTAVGTAGFFMWFGMSVVMLSKIGAEVCVSQSVGKNDMTLAKNFARNAMYLDVIMALIYSVFLIFSKKHLIGFFKLQNAEIVQNAELYLSIVALGMVFTFLNPVLTGIFNGFGDSKTPFYINLVGLVTNMILDPVLIFGIGPIPKLEIAGAAIATVASQFIVTALFIIHIKSKKSVLKEFKFRGRVYISEMKELIKLGLPAGIQNALFCFFSMSIARIITNWGDIPIAVQKVGSQIESISWMTAGGFATATGAFTGQNYGAKKWDRILKGYFVSLGLVSAIGLFASFMFIVFPEPIFKIFISEKEALKEGVIYLRILGISQLFMCIEIVTAGAFNGLGKTAYPSIISIIFTGSRVPIAYLLSNYTSLGLQGVWWTISVTSIVKGIIMVSIFAIYLKKNPHFHFKKFF